MSIQVPSFCKINLWLEVAGRREDGYHQIRTVLQSLDLQDTIELEERSEPGIDLEVRGRSVSSGADNLVVRAAALYIRRVGRPVGLNLRLDKRIPIGAGLGGGSGNAAATLAGVNRLAGDALGRAELASLGALIGSDVPFFLWGGSALALGRGEQIRPWSDLPVDETVLLVWPGFEVSTARIYEALGAPKWNAQRHLTSEDPGTTIREFFSARDLGRWGNLRNDLESAAVRLHPKLGVLKEFLLECGCREVMLAGSGSTVFGMGDPATLQGAAERCGAAGLRDTFLCRPLSRSEYCRRWAAAGIRLRD